MIPRTRIFILLSIMIVVTFIVQGVAIILLYQTAFNEERTRLKETVISQARLMEAVAMFDLQYSNDYPEGSRKATLRQIIEAHRNYKGFGLTGEFTLAERDGDSIVFIMNHRYSDLVPRQPVSFDSGLAEPMKMALSGKSGTMIGIDYRGARVLAAYEPVKELNSGIVAKIDLSEIRAPFIRAALISGLIGLVVIMAGVFVFLKITNPLIRNLYDTVESLNDALTRVKQLSGLLPICSSCKRIRDDKGGWNQIEVYIKDRSEAQFTHSLCPDCARKLYNRDLSS